LSRWPAVLARCMPIGRGPLASPRLFAFEPSRRAGGRHQTRLLMCPASPYLRIRCLRQVQLSSAGITLARLPNPGADTDQWGALLNSYLQVSHAPDGTLKNYPVNVRDFGATGDGTTD